MKILLIVPCYNEENRFNGIGFLKGKHQSSENDIQLKFLFADDGSTDHTKAVIEKFTTDSGDLLFSSPANLGKANIIQAAYQHHLSYIENEKFDWIGYWDGDLATPLEEVSWMIRYLDFAPSPSTQAIWGSRISRLGSDIRRQLHRHYLGRIFVTIVSNVLDVHAYDSQCGAKLFTLPASKVAFKEPFISRWIFDVEILLRLKEQNILEYPLRHWEDIPGSKVKIFREIFRVGWDLLKIKRTYRAP